ncbi:MAG: hypothetical protein JKX74_00365 [Flavobacteriales bacterium]|nr:hypothetical protein [Flavobacteriales bacterium]
MSKIKQAIVGGAIGTAVMTGFMMITPMMGFPKMEPATMLSGIMGIHIGLGWAIHFTIGIIFALGYALLIINWLHRISNIIVKGAVFGVLAWAIAQAAFAGMGAMMGGLPPPPEEGIGMMMVGGVLNHAVFGIVVGIIVKGE